MREGPIFHEEIEQLVRTLAPEVSLQDFWMRSVDAGRLTPPELANIDRMADRIAFQITTTLRLLGYNASLTPTMRARLRAFEQLERMWVMGRGPAP